MQLHYTHHLREVSMFDPSQSAHLLQGESLYYRRALLFWFTLLRAFAIVVLGYGSWVMFGRLDFSQWFHGYRFFVFSATYFCWQGVVLLFLHFKLRGMLIWALLDMLALTAMAMVFPGNQPFNPILALIPVSLLFSTIAMTLQEVFIFALAVTLMMIFWLVLYALLGQAVEGDLVSNYRQSAAHLLHYLDVSNSQENATLVLVALGIGALVVVVGYFSAQARDAKIRVLINDYFLSNLSRLNASVIEEMGSALVVVNDTGFIALMNRRAKALFSTEGVILRRLYELSPELMNHYRAWKKGSERFFFIEREGEKFSVSFESITGAPNIRMVLIKIENAEEHYQRVRENRLTSLGRLSASIAHEIRNPLSTIQQAGDLLAERIQDPIGVQLTEKIHRNSQRIDAIINEILQLMQSDKQEGSLFALNPFLLKIIPELRETKAIGHHADFETLLAPSEGFLVRFSQPALKNILHNLVYNAVRHNEGQKVKIIFSTLLSQDGEMLYLDVIDNGRGIPEALREKIFEPFYSSGASTGLGLYIVREMANANGARIQCVKNDSTFKDIRGACFRLSMRRYALNRAVIP